MTAVLQRIGHREALVGFVLWSVFLGVFLATATGFLTLAPVLPAVALATAAAIVGFGAVATNSVARRGPSSAIVFVTANALPLGIGGALATALVPDIGWPLLAAPALLILGGIAVLVIRRPRTEHQNPGSAAAGAVVIVAVLAWSAVGTATSLNRVADEGVRTVRSYIAEYDCVDAPTMRLARVIHAVGSYNDQLRIADALQLDQPVALRTKLCRP